MKIIFTLSTPNRIKLGTYLVDQELKFDFVDLTVMGETLLAVACLVDSTSAKKKIKKIINTLECEFYFTIGFTGFTWIEYNNDKPKEFCGIIKKAEKTNKESVFILNRRTKELYEVKG